MTGWGALLLVIYVGLGVSRVSWGKAARVAALLTALVVGAVMVKTISSG